MTGKFFRMEDILPEILFFSSHECDASECQGCKDAGSKIFSDPVIKQIVEEFFVPCAFNTWDRSISKHNKAMRQWSAGLESS